MNIMFILNTFEVLTMNEIPIGDIIEAKLLVKFLNDPDRLLLSDEEQMEKIELFEKIGKKAQEKFS